VIHLKETEFRFNHRKENLAKIIKKTYEKITLKLVKPLDNIENLQKIEKTGKIIGFVTIIGAFLLPGIL
jgi:hypothetical protein